MPDELQFKHERFCGVKLLEILGVFHSHFRHGRPDEREPDLVFKLRDHDLGIEVTSAFPEDDPSRPNRHAKEAWKFARRPTFDEHGVHKMPGGFDPDKNLAREIKSRLDEKCQRHYRGVAEIWLVIYAQTVVTDSQELDDVLRGMQIPVSHRFARIFILHVTVERHGGYRARQIFPEIADYLD
jgi:hypothetical protein